jgi:hypothetical protein
MLFLKKQSSTSPISIGLVWSEQYLGPGFIGIYVTPHIAHVIPNRAFHSAQQRAQFIALLKNKITTAGKKI